MSQVILLHCIHNLEHHMLEEGVPHLIIPAIRDRTGSALDYFTSHTKPLTYQEEPNKPPTQREHGLSHNDVGSFWDHASLFPPQFIMFYPDGQYQHLCTVPTILDPCILAQTEPMFSDVGRGYNNFVGIDVIDVS